MKLLRKGKDGGPESTVTGYWIVEIKRLFSLVLLKFEDGSRDSYHNHAFNSLNWILDGEVREQNLDQSVKFYRPSWWPVVTKRDTFHRVVSKGTTWVLSLRGPWSDRWTEFEPKSRRFIDLTHGRREI